MQQILLLPRDNKACILCNWTVTFYSLPELSPISGFPNVPSCNWIGGVDLNTPQIGIPQEEDKPGTTVLLSLNKKIKVVRIADDARALRVRVSLLHCYQMSLSLLTVSEYRFCRDHHLC